MENILSLQDLKHTPFAKLKKMFTDEPDVLVQERGKNAFIIVELEHYDYLKTCELEISLLKAKKEIAEGKFTTGTDTHIKKLNNSLNKQKPNRKNV